MKSLRYIFLFVLSILAQRSYGQCTCSATIIPVNECCGELQLFFDPGCDPAAFYNQIVIDPTFAPPFTGRVASITFNVPGFSSGIDP
ncbi:MAG: hypothetical protein KDC44_13645, partial [Phaeodactylibacter sp.]|nr:hypothetical protein [Phaeodactylibacter sp.]